MRKFIINVNGTAYDVEVEEVGASSAPVSAQTPAPVQQSAPKAAAAPKKAAAPTGKGTPVNSPMPGNVLDIKVATGASVKKGDVLLILEAMKMENEIVAPQDGVVTVVTSKGATVNSGDCLVTIA
ncbi:MAG: biotin/lipoyl-containing protein [Clostridia bacterium]|nr:biotin/lipoyl-containing protein [Clostridia bacterium]